MIILGIDPGYAIVGWGVLEYKNNRFRALDYGAILTKAGTPTPERLHTIYRELTAIIHKYRPDAMAVEELFFNTNQKTGIIVAEARGVILLSAVENGVPLYEYTPLQVKQSVVGYGRAEKKQVISMVTMFLNLDAPPKPDALALAICHAHCGGSRLGQYYNK